MRKEANSLTKADTEELRHIFHLHSEDDLAKRFNVSKSTISTNISKSLKQFKNKAKSNWRFDTDPKQPYWTSEDEMIIPNYSVDELEGWESEILLSLV